jgi:hypothetical protein
MENRSMNRVVVAALTLMSVAALAAEKNELVALQVSATGSQATIRVESSEAPVFTVFRDRKSTRLNSSHNPASRMPSSA